MGQHALYRNSYDIIITRVSLKTYHGEKSSVIMMGIVRSVCYYLRKMSLRAKLKAIKPLTISLFWKMVDLLLQTYKLVGFQKCNTCCGTNRS